MKEYVCKIINPLTFEEEQWKVKAIDPDDAQKQFEAIVVRLSDKVNNFTSTQLDEAKS